MKETAGRSSVPGTLTPRQETVRSLVTGGVVGMRTDSLQRRNAETPASDAVGASPAVNLLRTLDEVAIVKLVGINSVIGRTAAVLFSEYIHM